MMADNSAGAISDEEIGCYHSPSQHPSAAGAYREGHPTEECWKTASWATRRLRGLSRVHGNGQARFLGDCDTKLHLNLL
jgi:hypothetical protein